MNENVQQYIYYVKIVFGSKKKKCFYLKTPKKKNSDASDIYIFKNMTSFSYFTVNFSLKRLGMS